MITEQIVTFLPVATLIAFTPGANNILCLQNSTRLGFSVAVRAVAGRFLAYMIMVALVIAGFGKLLETSEIVFQCIKWGGAMYLGWIGINMLLAPVEENSSLPNQEDNFFPADYSGTWFHIRKEFLVAMTNPKAILLFGALLPQFIDPTAKMSYGYQMLVFGFIYGLLEWFTAASYALMGKAVTTGHGKLKKMLVLQKAAGCVLLAFSGVLALSQRTQH